MGASHLDAAILLSVVIALTVGTAVMYVSRLIFSFRYTRALSRYGALWCGASLTAIIYFALFKGLKGTLSQTAFIHMVENHIILSLLVCWLVCSLILFFVQRFKINILRITILGGTFARALAFAGNDLVNFIGVPIAGWDAFRIARHAGDSAMTMDALNENVPANFAFLVGAGVVMILTLWTSRKAMHVTETELSLASQNDEQEQREYGSSAFARAIVRDAQHQPRHRAGRSPTAPRGDLPPLRSDGHRAHRRTVRHDPRHGQPHHFGTADRHGHIAQTAAVDHLRHLHGGHGFFTC